MEEHGSVIDELVAHVSQIFDVDVVRAIKFRQDSSIVIFLAGTSLFVSIR